jgi:hypothetical protein
MLKIITMNLRKQLEQVIQQHVTKITHMLKGQQMQPMGIEHLCAPNMVAT